jgi:hypothetical protein
MDPGNPGAHLFPSSSFITVAQLRVTVAQLRVTVAQLRVAVTEWAFGEILPPPSLRWRQAADEVRWL